MKIKIKKINKDSILPTYAHDSDAGMDIYSAEEVRIPAGEIARVGTGIKMEIPYGFTGLIWGKSGLAANNGLETMAGVVDSGYRGEVQVVLINHGKKDFIVTKGLKIAQMLIQRVEQVVITEVEELSDSQRGEKGFGSTGN